MGLDAACGGDQELRAEVESLLAAHDDADDSVQRAIAELASEIVDSPAGSSVGRVFGPWRLTRLIARGGMATV